MSTYNDHFFVGLKNPRSVRVDVTVRIVERACPNGYSADYCSGHTPGHTPETSDFDAGLFEAEWQGIGAKILEERKRKVAK